jgi:hypothetical protein
LDKNLEATSSRRALQELQARILVCDWSQRLWTLQEAVFAKSLHYQFADGAVADKFIYQFFDGMDPIKSQFDLAGAITEDIKSEDTSARLLFVSVAVSRRSTSKADDEAFCLATLLGHDLKEFMKRLDAQKSHDKRPGNKIEIFWDMQKHVPPSIIFLKGEKLEADGYSWAPASLMKIESGIPIGPSAPRAPGGGLLITSGGWLITSPLRRDRQITAFEVTDNRGDVFYLRIDEEAVFSERVGLSHQFWAIEWTGRGEISSADPVAILTYNRPHSAGRELFGHIHTKLVCTSTKSPEELMESERHVVWVRGKIFLAGDTEGAYRKRPTEKCTAQYYPRNTVWEID